MEPVFTNDAIVLGLLLAVLALVFKTASSAQPGWKKFYTYIPSLVLCYFLPALLHWPLGLIAPEWFDNGLLGFLEQNGMGDLASSLPSLSFEEIKVALEKNGVAAEEYGKFIKKFKTIFCGLQVPFACQFWCSFV
ncbi:MAG: hypothetical protein R2784_19550 [Saprospiraceae bacterium]